MEVKVNIVIRHLILFPVRIVIMLYHIKRYLYSTGITAMSAQVVGDPTAAMDTEHHHKSSMALSRSSSDKHSSVPRRRLLLKS